MGTKHMLKRLTVREVPSGPSKEERLHQLERLLESKVLHDSEHLKAFLKFIVEKSLEGEADQIKEFVIATEVFGRGPDYDPRVDSVVRVQAVRLRAKLREYYEGEGRDDPVVIELPKGHYAPCFHYRSSRELDKSWEQPPHRSRAGFPVALWGVALCLLGVTLASSILAWNYRSESQSLKSQIAGHICAPSVPAPLRSIWRDFLSTSEPVIVSYSNALFYGRPDQGLRYAAPFLDGKKVEETVPRPYIGFKEVEQWQLLNDSYTGVGEVVAVQLISDLFARANHPLTVKRSRLLSWDDVRNSNVVFLGSPGENYPLRQLPVPQDFIFKIAYDSEARTWRGRFVNLKPRPGEPAVSTDSYDPQTGRLVEDYALVSLLPGLSPNRRVMVLAGINTYGTQAAAEYVARPEYAERLIERLGGAASEKDPALPDYYQVLLRVAVNDGVPVKVEYITHHVLEPPQ